MPPRLVTPPAISIIVATRNRASSLAAFLEVVKALPRDPSWELIVANNGSTDGTASLLKKARASLPVLSLEVTQPGKSRALNEAMPHAQGELLLFTDDDIIPETGWLSAMVQAGREFREADVFGGRITIEQDRLPRWVAASYNLKTLLASEQEHGDSLRWFESNEYPAGPNIAVRREALLRGEFCWPTNLGPGTAIPVGDERAFLMQISQPEVRDRLYVPKSVVRHRLVDKELTLPYAMTRCFFGGYAAGLLGRKKRSVESARRHASILSVARRQSAQISSIAEAACVAIRALGVVAGATLPFPRVRFC